MNKNEVLEKLKKGLIISCQALEGEVFYSEKGGLMPLFAKAALKAGAIGIRANSVRDILEIKKEVDLPMIGIIKKDYPDFEAYITPSMDEIDALVKTNVEIIAFDGTKNTRANNLRNKEFIRQIKEKYPNQLLMADISDFNEAKECIEAGVDFVGTTLSGYVKGNEIIDGPDFQLVKDIVENFDTPVIAEGRIHSPEDALKMLEIGAFCVVVGGAITRPYEIAKRFVNSVKKLGEK
ncbi:MAG: N-acetylmannosamine-6-phosphate 2-epimerase [Erysipelotrichaceae bacterium]|nr:N-acetylmannosamine-6-phosphate 2-epimerase [Erysipelotrichaceae bacterium]